MPYDGKQSDWEPTPPKQSSWMENFAFGAIYVLAPWGIVAAAVQNVLATLAVCLGLVVCLIVYVKETGMWRR